MDQAQEQQLSPNMEILQHQAALIENLNLTAQEQQLAINTLDQQRMQMERQLEQQQSKIQRVEQQIIDQDSVVTTVDQDSDQDSVVTTGLSQAG